MPVTIAHAKSLTQSDLTGTITVNNSSGGTNTVVATDLMRPGDWNSSHVATLAPSAAEIASLFAVSGELSISTSTNGITFYEPQTVFSGWEPFPLLAAASTMPAAPQSIWLLDPVYLPQGLDSGQINILGQVPVGFKNGAVFSSANTGSYSRTETGATLFAVYKAGAGNSTTRLESVYTVAASIIASWERRVSNSVINGTTTGVSVSNSLALSFPSQYNASGGVTYGTTGTVATTLGSTSTLASTFADNIVSNVDNYASGSFMVPIPFATSLAPGAYYFGFMHYTSTQGAGTNYSAGTGMPAASIVGVGDFLAGPYKRIGTNSSNASTGLPTFHGTITTATTAPFATLATSDIRNWSTTTGNRRMYWNHIKTVY